MDISRRLIEQEGVISRRQVVSAGMDDVDIERMIRRREWARVFRGVYVDHTGPLTRAQRHWAATLVHHPSALSGATALVAHGMGVDRPTDDIELIIPADTRVADPPGIRTIRARDFDALVHPSLGPPRVRLEHAVLMVASRATSDDRVVAVLADACQQRRTTAARLQTALADRRRLPRRQLMHLVLHDVACGSYSALEHRYLTRVERPHGFPTASRQRRVRPGGPVCYRDVEYSGLGVVVELDGRLGHEAARDRWRDLERDLGSLLQGDLTIRLGWSQVLEPCRLATEMATVLQGRGWKGRLKRCRSCLA
jgi:hypothetical protein